MKSFRFTLEPILTMREREEEKALENYSAKLRAKTQAELRVYHTEQQLQSLRAEYNASIGNAMFAGEIRQFTNYIGKVSDRKMSEQAALKFTENEMAAALQGVMKARQRKEAIHNLKSKDEARHREAGVRHEQKLIDDLVTSRAGRASAA